MYTRTNVFAGLAALVLGLGCATAPTATPQPVAVQPAPTPTPTPEAEIVLPKGAVAIQPGPHWEAELLKALNHGGVAYLAAGEFQTPGLVFVKQKLRLVGAGRNRTILRSEVSEAILTGTNSQLAFEHLSIQAQGDKKAYLVRVANSQLELTDCNLSQCQGKYALLITEKSRAKLQNCLFEKNQGHGAFVVFGSQASARDCQFVEQKGIGWDCWDASCALENCEFRGCGEGVAFEGKGEKRISHSKISQCSGVGVNIRSGGGLVENCQMDTMTNGIEIKGTPDLRSNHVQNCQVGLMYLDGGGKASNNVSEKNNLHGMEVGGSARPTLTGNLCKNNKLAGLSYFAQAGGTATNNTLEANRWGLVIESPAQPKVTDSHFLDNQEKDELQRDP